MNFKISKDYVNGRFYPSIADEKKFNYVADTLFKYSKAPIEGINNLNIDGNDLTFQYETDYTRSEFLITKLTEPRNIERSEYYSCNFKTFFKGGTDENETLMADHGFIIGYSSYFYNRTGTEFIYTTPVIDADEIRKNELVQSDPVLKGLFRHYEKRWNSTNLFSELSSILFDTISQVESTTVILLKREEIFDIDEKVLNELFNKLDENENKSILITKTMEDGIILPILDLKNNLLKYISSISFKTAIDMILEKL